MFDVQVGQVLTSVLCTLALALLVHLTLAFLRAYRKQQRDLLAAKNFTGPPGHWLLGNLEDMAFDEHQLGKQRRDVVVHSPGILLRIGMNVNLSLNGPHALAALCSTAEPKDDFAYEYIKPWIGDGLLVSSGPKWARNRRLLTHAFHFDILRPYVGVFSDSANILVNKWRGLCREQESIEMFHHVSLFTLDSLMKCIFGYTSNCQSSGQRLPYIQGVYDLTELVIKRFTNPLYISDLLYYCSWNGYKFCRACRLVHQYSRDVIGKKREAKERNKTGVKTDGKKYLDFLDILLDARDEDGVGLTDEEIQQEVDTFMFEGHDTTASGLSWFLYNLANHPEYQQKCRAEIKEVLGDRNHVTWDDLPKLEYLTMCLKESLRLYPPVPNTGRKLTKPLTLPDGSVLPVGFWLGIGIYQVHHNPKVWDDPEVYDPERFSSDNCKERHSHAFIPFSAGPRNCIGQHFAMHELKTATAIILQNFELQVDPTKPATPMPELVIRSASGVWLKLRALS